MAPGFADKLKFNVGLGLTVGGVNDYKNGIYRQVVRYDSRFVKPVVVPTGNRINISGSVTPDDFCHLKALCDRPIIWVWLMIILLLLLVFMVFLLLLRCCRTRR